MPILARRSFSPVVSTVMIALVVACSDSTSPPQPTGVTASAAVSATATVGSAVGTPPAVKVVDGKGAPVAGVAVQFTVTAGGGTLGRSSATTDASGVASAESWKLGTTAGVNTVDATVSGLPVVHFSVTGTAAAAASIAALAGDAQSAPVGTALATAPSVVVKDQYGNVVAGAAVTFAVTSGGGTVAGGTVTTGADGVARVGGWTLGISVGAQQLRASAGTLGTTLSATGFVASGCTATNYALGATLPLAWETDDCVSTNTTSGVSMAGRRYDKLQFSTTAQQIVDATVAGPSGRTLLLRDATSGMYVGLQPGSAFSPASQSPMHLKYVLAPGSYVFEPHAPNTTATGAYSFSTATGTKVDCDYIVFATTNVQFTDTIDQNACIGPTGEPEQWINLQLRTGTKVRITLSNSDFVPILVLRDDRLGPASPTIAVRSGTAAGDSVVIDYTATFDTWHEVIVVPKGGASGKYTLKIEQLP
jgi:hypothetical protein